MKLKHFLGAAFLLLSSTGMIQSQTYSKTANGIKANVCAMDVEIQFYSPGIVRVVKSPENTSFEKNSFSVIKTPENVEWQLKEEGKTLVLNSNAVVVTMDLQTGKITFTDTQGKKLLTEKDYGAQFTPVEYDKYNSSLIRQAFMLDKEEAIYGLGQQQTGKMNQRNQALNLQQVNSKICIPYIQSVKGYGLFWDNYSPTRFTDNPQEMAFDSQAGDCADYYFMYSDGTADGVIACMRDLTGQVPMNSLWTYGFWQSRERYKSQEEIVGVVKKFRDLKVPLDGIIQDWRYWGDDFNDWNAVDFGNPAFPEPKRMLDETHALNAHMIISVWPSFGKNTRIYKTLDEKGLLLDFKTFPEPAKVYDTFHPEARKIYWDQMNKNIFSIGMDGWWLDATEPEIFDNDRKLNQSNYLGLYRKNYNAFPIVTVGSIHDNQRSVNSDKRVFILTRSAFAGQQRYGANSWSGDITSTWEVLRKQIPAGLNFSVCGIPYWNADIGGFHAHTYPEGIKDPAYQELYVRWTQFGAFTPMMRSHGTNTPREIYLFGDRGTWAFDAQEKYINLRYALLPYLYSTAWSITDKADTYMRGLFMDFPEDSRVHDIDNEYMFGRAFLVAPVTESMYVDENKHVNLQNTKAQDVYLPKGTDWFDFWTGEKLNGGQMVNKQTPIDIMPLYVKAGSILPIGPKVQYATEKKWDNLEIRIYRGANGEFTLYEDENDNYNYEKGAYSTIRMQWDDQNKTFTIGNREGEFPGMLTNRKFRIVLVDKTRGTGDKAATRINKTVSYNGKQQKIKL